MSQTFFPRTVTASFLPSLSLISCVSHLFIFLPLSSNLSLCCSSFSRINTEHRFTGGFTIIICPSLLSLFLSFFLSFSEVFPLQNLPPPPPSSPETADSARCARGGSRGFSARLQGLVHTSTQQAAKLADGRRRKGAATGNLAGQRKYSLPPFYLKKRETETN